MVKYEYTILVQCEGLGTQRKVVLDFDYPPFFLYKSRHLLQYFPSFFTLT